MRSNLAVDRLKQPGNIRLVERQTSMGVNIAEQIAAKTVLQNAVAAVAERTLPTLVK